MRNHLENGEVKNGRDPEDDVEKKRAEKFCEHDLPVAHWRGHERLDRTEFKFFREQAHRDQRKNQDEREPEEDRIKKRFLHRVGDRPLIHVGKLEIEIDAAHQQEKEQDDVSDRRIKIAAHFARKECVKFSHVR